MSGDDARSFDLVDQPWVLARDLHGTVREFSLVDVLADAHKLQCLVGEVPTQVFAMTRLLLAILHRAVDGPKDVGQWENLWNSSQLPVNRIAKYLNAYKTRFDLLHPKTPFLQVADLHTAKGEMSDLSKLIADMPNGRPFFSSYLSSDLSLSFSEAARWVVHCHAFDPSGIKSGAVGDPRVKGGKGYPIGTGWSGYLGGVLAEGATLRESLLLNLVSTTFDDMAQWQNTDQPAWERPPTGPTAEPPTGSATGGLDTDPGDRAPLGPTDLYTWQSRRIRLSWRDDRVTGVLIGNGNRITPQNRHHVEPHTAWRRSEAQEKKLRLSTVYMPREHDPQRAVWRGLQSLLPGNTGVQREQAAVGVAPIVLNWVGYLTENVLEPDFPVSIRAIGMTYGSQRSVTDDIVDDAVQLRALLLSRDASPLVGVVLACVTAAEKAARAVGTLAGGIAVAGGGESDGPRSRATELAYSELDTLFRRWLAAVTSDTDPMLTQVDWHRQVKTIARQLGDDEIDRAPMSALIGRSTKHGPATTAHAEQRFRRELRAALPFAYVDVSTTNDNTPTVAASLQNGPSV
jgi:CRISPR system Cascade subunit CasA